MPVITGNYNIIVHWHTTFKLVVLVTDSAGDPVPLTGGASVYAEIGDIVTGIEYLDLEPTITDAAGGEITISKEVNEPTVGENWVWDLLVTYSDGTTDKLLTGKAPIRATISDHA